MRRMWIALWCVLWLIACRAVPDQVALSPSDQIVPSPSNQVAPSPSDQIASSPSVAASEAAVQHTVLIFFTPTNDPNPAALVAVEREVTAEPDVPARLAAAINALLAGPSDAEREAGLTSWFSSATAGALNGVSVDQEGAAFVDFANFSRTIGGASSSAGSVMLFSQLNSTVFQFPAIQSVTYAFDGSCAAMGEWTQAAGCQTYTRAQWETWIESAASPDPTQAMASTIPEAACEVAPSADPSKLQVGGEPNIECLIWPDNYTDETGFRIVLSYGDDETLTYEVPENTVQLMIPPADRPRFGAPQNECLRRSSFSLSVYAIRPSGDELIDGIGRDGGMACAKP